jgi:type 1 glutamine amidotransferase
VGATPIKSVLHFSKTGYFRHTGGIAGCTTALNSLASQYHFTVKHSEDYNDVVNVKNYDIVIYDNNTDAGGVSNNENAGQQALKSWLMSQGGKFLGFHAASDHRGQWTWYDTALFSGLQFTTHGDGAFSLYRDTSAATKANSPLQRMYQYAQDSLKLSTQVVQFSTEYYHFMDSKTKAKADARGRPGVTSFQELRGNQADPTGTQGQVFGWVKTLPNNGRVLYTSLGHETPEWTANDSWLTKMTWAYMKYLMGDFDDPVSIANPEIQTQGHSLRVLSPEARRVQVIDIAGRVVASGNAANFEQSLPKAGVYFVKVDAKAGKTFSKAITIN